MENEKFKVIRIDTGKAVTSVKELRKYIQDLRDSLLQVQTDENQLKQTTDALSQAQSTLADVTGRSAKEMSASETSIVGMRKEYKQLYDQYKLLSEAQRNSPLGKEMASNLSNLSNSINNANKGVGNFKDNIGRYTESMSKALGSVGGAFKGLSGPIKGASALFKGLNAAMGPVGIIIGALVLAFKALSNGIKGNSENAEKFSKIMAKLKGLIVPVQRAIEKLASVLLDSLGKALEKITQKLEEFASKLHIKWLQNFLEDAKQASDVAEGLQDRWNKNEQLRIQLINERTDMEREAARLRQEAQEVEATNANKAIELRKKATDLEIAQLKKEKRYEQEKWDIMVLQNAQAGTSLEMREKEAEQRAVVLGYDTQIAELRGQTAKKEEKLQNKAEKQQKEVNEQLKQYYETLLKAAAAEKDREKYMKLSLEYLDLKLRLEKQAASSAFTGTEMLDEMLNAIDTTATEERLNIILQFYKDTYEAKLKEAALEKDSEERRQKEMTALKEYTKQLNTLYHIIDLGAFFWGDIPEEVKEAFSGIDLDFSPQQRNELQAQVNGLFKEITDKALADIKAQNDKRDIDLLSSIFIENSDFPEPLEIELQNAYDIMKFWQQKYDDFKKGKNVGYSSEEITKNYAEAIKAVREGEEKLWDEITKKRTTEMQNVSALWGESEIRTLKQNVEIARYELERVQRNVGESEEDFYARRLEAQRKFNNASAALNAQYLTNFTETMTAIGSLLGSGGDAWEEYINLRVNSGKLTNAAAKKEFENLKKYRYSETVLNTLAGAIAAYTSAQSLGVPWGPIVGGANAAAVTAAGAAQLMKISQTHFGEGSVDSTIKAGQTRYTDGYIEYANGRSTGTSELSELNKTVQALSKQVKDVKVIVTEGDVTRMQNIVQAKVAEASW